MNWRCEWTPIVSKKNKRKRGKKGVRRLGYTSKNIELLLSKQGKSMHDKIKETLHRNSRKELLAICEDEVFPSMNPFMRARMQYASDAELMEAIADMRLLRMKSPIPFDVKRYYKNLFKGRQKGRAYKSFWQH